MVSVAGLFFKLPTVLDVFLLVLEGFGSTAGGAGEILVAAGLEPRELPASAVRGSAGLEPRELPASPAWVFAVASRVVLADDLATTSAVAARSARAKSPVVGVDAAAAGATVFFKFSVG